MDRGQYYQRVELLDHNLRTTVCQHVHGSQHHTEAMEERNATTELVVSGEFHMLAGQQTVVRNIMVCQHNPFREACRAGGILHIDNIVAVNELFSGFQFVVFYIFAQQ